MIKVENKLKVNHEYIKLENELESLGELMKSVENTIRCAVENYKGSDLERYEAEVYRSQHPPYFKVYTRELINRVLREYVGNVYEIEGEEGLYVVVRQVAYNKPSVRTLEELEDKGQLKPEHTYDSLRLILDVKERVKVESIKYVKVKSKR